MFTIKINSALIVLFNMTIILVLSSCSTLDEKIDSQSLVNYQYPYQCSKNGQLVNHSITAKVPLSVVELKVLKSTLQENLGLDFGSCVFVGEQN